MAILEYLLGHEPDNQNNAHWESLGSVPSVSQWSSPPLSDIGGRMGYGPPVSPPWPRVLACVCCHLTMVRPG